MATQKIQRELPWSWHRTPEWRGQFARVCRWYERLCESRDPAFIEDALYAFFQNCYHLRDWLTPEEFPSATVQAFLDAHVEMRVCRDICNLTKHRELTRPPAQGFELCIVREYSGPGRGWFEDDSRLTILTNNMQLDAREVAGRCVQLWRDFLPLREAA